MPEDRPSFPSSRLSAADVARHNFSTVRKGLDPGEVRAYLELVAEELRHWEGREDELRRVLAEAEEKAAHPVLDEATLTGALGQQSAQVLRHAHEEAARILRAAEERAATTVREAEQHAGELQVQAESTSAARIAEAELSVGSLREQVDREVAAIRVKVEEEVAALRDRARQDAERLLAETRERGRAMIEQAQEARRRVLADAAQRRRALGFQIDQLRAARDQLASAVASVRQSVDGIVAGLGRADHEAREAAAGVARSQPSEVVPGDAALLEAATELVADLDPAHQVEELTAIVRTVEAGGGAEETAGAPAAVAVQEAEAPPDGEPGSEDADHEPSAVDALFARIRAEVIEDEDDADGSPEDAERGAQGPEDPLVAARDAQLSPVAAKLARRVKRALQDEQNRLLDRVRSTSGGWSADQLVPEDEERAALVAASSELLGEAADAGVAFAAEHGGEAGATVDPELVAGAADRLAVTVVTQLRRRLTGDEGVPAGAANDEAVDRIGAAYREWRGERVERLVGDTALEVFSAGVLAAAGSGTLQWVTGGGTQGCADCDDNALGGAVAAGEAFPTGHRHPPAHTGCRCAVVPTTA